MEEEPAERVTTHHGSAGTQGLRRRGWKVEERDGGGDGRGSWHEVALMEGTCPVASLVKSTQNPSLVLKAT